LGEEKPGDDDDGTAFGRPAAAAGPGGGGRQLGASGGASLCGQRDSGGHADAAGAGDGQHRAGADRRPLLAGHEELLRQLTTAKPGITLAELRAALAGHGIAVGSLTTIWTTLRRLGLRHKKRR
jgi:hypothetical protein